MTWTDAASVALGRIGATAVMDVWSLALKRLGVPTLDDALVGRWAGHLRRGRCAHAAIGEAAAIPGERPLGWAIHDAVGIAFAALRVAVQGLAWLREPALVHGERRCAATGHATGHGRRVRGIEDARATMELPAQPGLARGIRGGALSVGRLDRAGGSLR
jgi:hypothetical protein